MTWLMHGYLSQSCMVLLYTGRRWLFVYAERASGVSSNGNVHEFKEVA